MEFLAVVQKREPMNRSEEIDYYFNVDHGARRRTALQCAVVGVVVVVLLSTHEIQNLKILVFAALAVLATILFSISRYHPDMRHVKSRTREKPSPQLIESRRDWGFAMVPVSFALLLLAIIRFPLPTEAEVVNRRIRRLRESGEESEANDFAMGAAKNGYPIDSNLLDTLGRTLGQPRSGLVSTSAIQEWNSSVSLARGRISIGPNEIVNIWLPVVYIPVGRYRISGTINTLAVSVTGDGPQKSYLLADRTGTDTTPLILFPAENIADVVFAGISVVPRNLSQALKANLLTVAPAPRKIVVINCEFEWGNQLLDSVEWITVRFRSCTLTCDGRQFELRDVAFENCDFDFAPDFPDDLGEELRRSSGRPVTMKYSAKA